MSAAPAPIVGAGLAGLIAAHAWPRAAVVERAPAPAQLHRALLRFRSEAVSALVGIPFRRVAVRKSVWSDGEHCAPSIRRANAYSRKVLGRILPDRSIWNVLPVDRFVAPETLYEQLVSAVGDRIHWGQDFDWRSRPQQVISTAPMADTLEALGIKHTLHFDRAPITVMRARVPACDVFQTVYFPDPKTSIYRASITGDLLIMEAVRDIPHDDIGDVLAAFGIDEIDILDKHKQHFGKIAPIDDNTRRRMLFKMTSQHGVYSLGRFATWRNILLDDVASDIGTIKNMMGSDLYGTSLHAART